MNSLIYLGDSEAEIIFIDATISNYGWYCAVGTVPGGTVRLTLGTKNTQVFDRAAHELRTCFTKMGRGNSHVAIIANSKTLKKQQDLAAEKARKASYAIVAASPPRGTRSPTAKVCQRMDLPRNAATPTLQAKLRHRRRRRRRWCRHVPMR